MPRKVLKYNLLRSKMYVLKFMLDAIQDTQRCIVLLYCCTYIYILYIYLYYIFVYSRKSSDMMHIIECVKCVTLHKILHVWKIYMFVYTHSTCVSCVFYILSTYYTGEICHFGWSGFVTYACLFTSAGPIQKSSNIFMIAVCFSNFLCWLLDFETIGTILRITKKNEKRESCA